MYNILIIKLPSGKISVNNRPQLTILQPNIIQVEANIFDFNISAEGDPAAAEPASVRRRIGDTGAQKAVVPLAHGLHLALGDGGWQVAQEDGHGLVQTARLLFLINNQMLS